MQNVKWEWKPDAMYGEEMRRYLLYVIMYIIVWISFGSSFFLLFKNETYFHPEICKAHLGHFRLCVFDSYGSPVGGD